VQFITLQPEKVSNGFGSCDWQRRNFIEILVSIFNPCNTAKVDKLARVFNAINEVTAFLLNKRIANGSLLMSSDQICG
jgi:hypothetical protein